MMRGFLPELDPPPDLKAQISEIDRELGVRERVYPNLIRRGTLSQRAADRQNDCLKATLTVLQRVQAEIGTYHLEREIAAAWVAISHAGKCVNQLEVGGPCQAPPNPCGCKTKIALVLRAAADERARAAAGS